MEVCDTECERVFVWVVSRRTSGVKPVQNQIVRVCVCEDQLTSIFT